MSADDRYYHNLRHLDAMTRHAHLLGFDRLTLWDDLFAAILFHYVVYDATRTDNEQRSADIARDRLAATTVDEEAAVRAILATKHHRPEPSDALSVALTDLDMAILSADDYRRDYAVLIRREYAHVPLSLYVEGRVGFLRSCLDQKIYFEPAPLLFTDELAHVNIRQEIGQLLENPERYLEQT